MYEEVLNLPLRASLAYHRALRILCPVARGLASVGERALVTRVWLASGHCYTELASAETALHCFLRGTGRERKAPEFSLCWLCSALTIRATRSSRAIDYCSVRVLLLYLPRGVTSGGGAKGAAPLL